MGGGDSADAGRSVASGVDHTGPVEAGREGALVVDVRGLVKSYSSTPAVRGIDLAIRHGEVFALLGPNGAGKTTTLEILEGFRARTGGEVSVLGVDPGTDAAVLRRHVGMVLQEAAIEPYLTVREVLTRNAAYYDHPRPVDDVVRLVGLEEKVDARVKTLSGGQQRRLDVGLGIVGGPELLFLDEPTTGFDPSAGAMPGTWCRPWPMTAPPSSSPRTTWRRRSASPTGSR